ncbi:2-aminoethylphosphonate transport system permease protein phnV [Mycobacteroides abscessus]|nr:2-aminoethylphosphonate transport system permease protein phnV [Mycobacteroides abscessus]
MAATGQCRNPGEDLMRVMFADMRWSVPLVLGLLLAVTGCQQGIDGEPTAERGAGPSGPIQPAQLDQLLTPALSLSVTPGKPLFETDMQSRQVAESLGAGSARVVRTVTLPLLMPSLGAAAGLAIALSMGELGATVMVYPSSWRTLPVTIFGLSDRGQVFSAAASTALLLMVTLFALLVVGRLRGKVALR